MAVADRHGLPVAVCVESATPHEVKLATNTLVQMIVPEAPKNLIGDNAYDSDRLDTELRRYGIELIAPHRSNRRNKTQDLRRMRRYWRRWKIERLFAWLQNFRRLVVRYGGELSWDAPPRLFLNSAEAFMRWLVAPKRNSFARTRLRREDKGCTPILTCLSWSTAGCVRTS